MIKLSDILQEIEIISGKITIKYFPNYRGDPGQHLMFCFNNDEEWYHVDKLKDNYMTTGLYLESEEDEWEEYNEIKDKLEKYVIPYEIVIKRDFEGFKISKPYFISPK